MRNIDIAHHPFRGNFIVYLHEPVDQTSLEPYFKAERGRITITGGLVSLSTRGIRIQRLGQGVFLKPSQVKKIKVGWKRIWPENKFLRFLRDLFAKITRKR